MPFINEHVYNGNGVTVQVGGTVLRSRYDIVRNALQDLVDDTMSDGGSTEALGYARAVLDLTKDA